MAEAKQSPETDHANVAPTAWGVAYLRSMTDIPLASEVFQGLEAQLAAEGEANPAWNGKRDRLAPQLEARYKLLEQLIDEAGNQQILELAAGIATHGMSRTSTNPAIRYVELDLPGVNARKRDIWNSANTALATGLSIVDGNALSEQDIRTATAAFDPSKPVTVVHEGLMRYLTFDEKRTLAENITSVLKTFGGVWITPDISLRSALDRENEQASGHTQNVAKTTGIDLDKNVFEDEKHAQTFFENLGFIIEKHSFSEVADQLVSPERLGMSADEVRRLNEPCIAFVMRLANN